MLARRATSSGNGRLRRSHPKGDPTFDRTSDMPSAPDRPRRVQDRTDSRVVWGALGISAVLHATILLMPVTFGGDPGPAISAADFFRRVAPSPAPTPSPTVSATPWPSERRSLVRTLGRVLDSVGGAQAAERGIRTWTGGGFSASPGQFTLFGLALPLCGGGANSSDCGFGVSPWRRAGSGNPRLRLTEIRSNKHLVDIRERAARIRKRRDARRDTTGGG